jgi:hypothetical protein
MSYTIELPDMKLESGWKAKAIELHGTSAIAIVLLEHAGMWSPDEKTFVRLDLGKKVILDELPGGIGVSRSALGIALSEQVAESLRRRA